MTIYTVLYDLWCSSCQSLVACWLDLKKLPADDLIVQCPLCGQVLKTHVELQVEVVE
jgi:NAD-dependent SIR2 family protein deacetylase